jgi:flagellar assembly protein FliH
MSAVLNRDAAGGYQRWEPPQVGDAPQPAAPAEAASHPTVSDLEALERQARDEGYAAGHAQGLAEARAQGRERVARLEAICTQAARPLDALDAAVEQELAQLALLVARRVIAHELATRPELIVQAVRQAAAALPAATRELKVRLHPDDLALLRELDAAEPHWQLVADATLARGDCLLQSERSRLDARVETRLAAMIDAVLGDEAEA